SSDLRAYQVDRYQLDTQHELLVHASRIPHRTAGAAVRRNHSAVDSGQRIRIDVAQYIALPDRSDAVISTALLHDGDAATGRTVAAFPGRHGAPARGDLARPARGSDRIHQVGHVRPLRPVDRRVDPQRGA